MDPREVSKLLADEYSVKILTATFRNPRSAGYLSSEFDIPIAACYRRIRALERAELLKPVDREFTKFGKWVSVYRSNLRYVNIVLENGQMRMYMQLSDPERPEHQGTWEILEESEE
ncbi:MAG: helix-turn-helix domain-containing protein [Candidatus Thermoplasmatota archaeon]|nr:helix-turn-helix domain-containing protein [Candidatus Thermoplasmatota archaeon]